MLCDGLSPSSSLFRLPTLEVWGLLLVWRRRGGWGDEIGAEVRNEQDLCFMSVETRKNSYG